MQPLCPCGDLQFSARMLTMGLFAQLIDARKLSGQLVSDEYKLIVDLVVGDALQYLVVPVQTADIAVMGLPPQSCAELPLQSLGLSSAAQQLHSLPVY